MIQYRVENKKVTVTFEVTVTLRCAPTGIRTPVLTLKGSRPGPLDDGGGTFGAGGILSSHLVMVKHLFELKLIYRERLR